MCSLCLYAADSLAGKPHVLERHSGEATGTVDHSKAENAERERETESKRQRQETETLEQLGSIRPGEPCRPR